MNLWSGCYFSNISWIRAVRHRTAVPHSSYQLRCMLEWSVSGHCTVCINHSAQNLKRWLSKTVNRRRFHLINICCKNSIQVLNLHGFLCRFWLCHSIYILKIIEKLLLVLGPHFRVRKSPETIQTQVKPNANRDWPMQPTTTSDRSWPDCAQILPGPPPHKMQMGNPILGISTLCVEIHNVRLANDVDARTFTRDRNASNKLPCSAFDGNTTIYTIYMIDIYLSMRKLFKNL